MFTKFKFKNFLELVAFIIIFALITIMFVQVFARKFLPQIPIWSGEEMSTLLLMWLASLGASIAAGRYSHISMDYLVEKFSEKNRSKIMILVNFMICLFLLVIGIVSLQLAWENRFTETSRLDLSMFWMQISITVGMIIMLYYYTKHLLVTIIKVKKPNH
ncbi:TRAP transporter small permease [Salibacterium salarium]|uniref:TRAP transporter small permease n=1 Tax=Salibacterium salarium TaxID=284579 RepID=A0A3R9PLT5_9BACI|nr:TRAP transporter small permease [Salibacterium salarium]RSL33645.1 TRAP transporter small permease [Salibacterium salarium]